MKIYEAIRNDHDIQRELLEKLVKTSGDTDKRHQIFSNLKKELDLHANAEERHFYKPLIPIDMMQEHARHGIAEHHEIHLEDEEHTFFQLSGKVLTEKQKDELGVKYNAYMNENR